MTVCSSGCCRPFEGIARAFRNMQLSTMKLTLRMPCGSKPSPQCVSVPSPWKAWSCWRCWRAWQLWKQEAKTIWPDAAWDEWPGALDLVGIDVGIRSEEKTCLEYYLQWLGSSSPQTRAFLKARVLLLQVLASRRKTVSHVPVRLSCSQFCILANRIKEFVVAHGQLASLDSREPYSGLRVESLRAVDKLSHNAGSLQCLFVIASQGIDIGGIGPFRDAILNTYPCQSTRWLWLLLGVRETDADRRRRRRRAKYVTISLTPPPEVLCGLFEAIRASGSLRSVSVVSGSNSPLPTDRRQVGWSWIAYTLFSDACCGMRQLEDVSLDVKNLTSDAVDRMREVLSAPDPLALLVGRRQPSLVMQTVSASRFSLVDPMTGNAQASDAVITDNDRVFEGLPVLAESSIWATVLVPGWGKAWVFHEDVKETKTRACGPFAIKSIPLLTLNAMTAESKDAAKELLLTVGVGVRHLTLDAREFWRQETVSYGCVFDACPNLESLEVVRPRLDSLQFFMDGYVSGTSRLAVFKATKRTERVLLTDSFLELVVALSDELHPAARHLRQLVVYPVALEDVMRPKIQSAIPMMLTRNKWLSVFDIRFDIHAGSADQRERCQRLSTTFDGEVVACPRSSVDIQRRLAFLSIIRPQSHATTGSCGAEKLCTDVLALIFEMAVRTVRRRVYVGPHYEEARQD